MEQEEGREDHFAVFDPEEVRSISPSTMGTPSNMVFSSKHGGKYCGMAEMCGPYNADANPQTWIEGLKGKQGVIPLDWIVVKDVAYSAFANVQHRKRPVTDVRHANV